MNWKAEIVAQFLAVSVQLQRSSLTINSLNAELNPISHWLVLLGKGKAVPLQAWSGPEGSRKLRFPDFMTTAQDGGRLSALRTGRLYPPGNTPGTHFC